MTRFVQLLGILLCLTLAMISVASLPPRPEPSPPSWKAHLARVDNALAANKMSAAVLAWRDAYGAARGGLGWEGMLAVGDAALRIGDATGDRRGFEPRARQSYLAALFRARQEGSLDGVMRTTEAFARLGDRAVAERGLGIADALAGLNLEAQARVRALAARVTHGSHASGALDVEPF